MVSLQLSLPLTHIVLLGWRRSRKGAGKTTTINMLTGALAPTSGTAIVAGNDVREKLDNIRQNIGICLQHDCLFPRLTVREHVQFFSRLKGLYSEVPYAEAEKQVDQAIKDVALFEKRNTFSKNLSGGMKRKLSVAIAFCGGSKVVLLDEVMLLLCDALDRRFFSRSHQSSFFFLFITCKSPRAEW